MDTCYQEEEEEEPSFWFWRIQFNSIPAMPSLQLLQLTERGRGLVASRR